MNSVYFDSDAGDDVRRRRLYEGQIYVFSPRRSTRRLCELARSLCEEAFAPHPPTEAQEHLDVERYVEVLRTLKPRFIHHPECKKLIPRILGDLGCALDRTYFDVPRLRIVTHGGYLTSGLGYAFKPHRDTWYSPPLCQLNWWLPVYSIEADNAMAFHLNYWARPVKNSSVEFDYQEWNRTGRKAAATLVKRDTRRQSEALEDLELDPQLRIVCPPGGLVAFSAAHMHSTVPNTSGRTRISVDFRTVHIDELEVRGGAPNLDSACSGTTIRDYLRGSDLSGVPDEVIGLFEDHPPEPDEMSPTTAVVKP